MVSVLPCKQNVCKQQVHLTQLLTYSCLCLTDYKTTKGEISVSPYHKMLPRLLRHLYLEKLRREELEGVPDMPKLWLSDVFVSCTDTVVKDDILSMFTMQSCLRILIGRAGASPPSRAGCLCICMFTSDRPYTVLCFTCAARVAVLGLSFFHLSVHPSVCPVPLILPLRATRRPKSNTNGFIATLA